MENFTIKSRGKKGNSVTLRVFLFVALVLPMLGISFSAEPARGAAAHPILIQTAAQTPDAPVSVIVQKGTTSREPEGLVAKMGGTVTKDLSIINAFVADMTARSAVELASSAGVRYVSPNATMEESSEERSTTWATDLVANSTSQISSGFTSGSIRSGSYVWFNSILRTGGIGALETATLNFDEASVLVNIGGQEFTYPIPAATIKFSPSHTLATTQYDLATGRWITNLPSRLNGTDVFLSGVAIRVPYDVPSYATSVTFTGRFTTDAAGVTVDRWQWSASTYSNFSTNMNQLGVKPCKDATASQYLNSNNAGTPESYKGYLIPGARSTGGTNYTGDYSPAAAVAPARVFQDADNMVDSGMGPNGTYGHGANAVQTFAGFTAEQSPSQRISRVDLTFKAYVLLPLLVTENPRITVKVDGVTVRSTTLQGSVFNDKIGLANAGVVYIDVTGNRTWNWTDLDESLQVTIDHPGFLAGHQIYYDAVGMRITTVAGADTTSGYAPTNEPNTLVDATKLQSIFPRVIKATDVWSGSAGRPIQGQGVTVAVIDSGMIKTDDLKDRTLAAVNFDDTQHNSLDSFGHGTFVAGIIAGDGTSSNGQYMGVAPKTNIINARVSGDAGMSTEADVVEALGWILANKSRYNIRVVNMSLNSSMMQSYHTSPLCAAAEVLWFNGIVVVVSAGNNGTANLYPPANDPFVITVGATDDRGTVTVSDDTMASFSAYGVTEVGTVKPELVAPGRNIISLLPENDETAIGRGHGSNRVNTNYFRMSGTSMSAPMVSGVAALLLQDEPNLNPDQVKRRLMLTAAGSGRWTGYTQQRAGAGIVDAAAALSSTSMASANTNLEASQLLWTGNEPINWQSVNWNSVNWNSVNWNSVNWNSVNWNSVNWNSTYWEP
jgi:serine protease AprX